MKQNTCFQAFPGQATLVLVSLLSAGLALSSSTAQAAVSLTQIGATSTWEVSFDPITFTANSNSGQFDWLVFEDFYDANSTVQGDYVVGTSTLGYSVNGGPTVNVNPVFRNGTFNQTLGGIDANDLFVNLAGVGPDPSAGSTVTISGSFQFTSSDVPTFSVTSVDAAFWDNGATGTIQSDQVAVTVIPEPSGVALLALGTLACLRRRRK
jgi:hypothetical protein